MEFRLQNANSWKEALSFTKYVKLNFSFKVTTYYNSYVSDSLKMSGEPGQIAFTNLSFDMPL